MHITRKQKGFVKILKKRLGEYYLGEYIIANFVKPLEIMQ